MNYNAAGKTGARQVARDFLPVAVLSVGKTGVLPAQIVIEKNQVEYFTREDLERAIGG